MLSSTLLDALMSIIRKVPAGRVARAMAASTWPGCAWSCTASNAVTRSKASGWSSVATSHSSNRALVRPRLRASALARGDRLLGEVEAHEPAGRVLPREDVDRVPAAAADIGHVDPGPQPRVQSLDERDHPAYESGVDQRPAVLIHQCVKPRVVGVGQATALAEAPHDVLLHLGQQGDEPHSAARLFGPASTVSHPACSGGRE